jgi:hypothetical protein
MFFGSNKNSRTLVDGRANVGIEKDLKFWNDGRSDPGHGATVSHWRRV